MIQIFALALALLLPSVAWAQLSAPSLIMDFDDSVDRSSYTTTTISPGVDTLVIVTVISRRVASAPPAPTLSGCGMTWTQIASQLGASSTARVTMFRSTSVSPGSGCALTASFTGDVQLGAWFFGHEWTNADVTGTNGSNGVVQSVADIEADADVSTASITLAAFGDAVNNAALGCWYHGSSSAATEGAGFTLSGDQLQDSARRGTCEYQIGEDTSVDMSWGGSGRAIGIALEIKMEDTAGGQAPRSMHQFRLRRM